MQCRYDGRWRRGCGYGVHGIEHGRQQGDLLVDQRSDFLFDLRRGSRIHGSHQDRFLSGAVAAAYSGLDGYDSLSYNRGKL